MGSDNADHMDYYQLAELERRINYVLDEIWAESDVADVAGEVQMHPRTLVNKVRSAMATASMDELEAMSNRPYSDFSVMSDEDLRALSHEEYDIIRRRLKLVDLLMVYG